MIWPFRRKPKHDWEQVGDPIWIAVGWTPNGSWVKERLIQPEVDMVTGVYRFKMAVTELKGLSVGPKERMRFVPKAVSDTVQPSEDADAAS